MPEPAERETGAIGERQAQMFRRQPEACRFYRVPVFERDDVEPAQRSGLRLHSWDRNVHELAKLAHARQALGPIHNRDQCAAPNCCLNTLDAALSVDQRQQRGCIQNLECDAVS